MDVRTAPDMPPLRVADFFTRESLRRAASMVTWFWAVALLLLIPFRWTQGAQTTLTSTDSPVSGITESAARGMLALTIATAGLVLVSQWSIAGEGFGGRWRQAAHPVGRFVRATVLVVGILWGAGLLRNLVEGLTGFSRTSDGSAWSTYTAADRAFAGLFAGTTEETLNIAVLAGSAFAIATAVSRWRVGRGRPALSSRTLWAVAVTAALLGLVTRFTDHIYQGGLGSLFAVLWGAGLLAVFAVCRSVLPLMLGHFLFDAFVAGNRLLPAAWLPYLAVFVIALGAVFALSHVQLGRRRRR